MTADGTGEVWTVVVAAGTGQRFGRPKQYELLGGRRVLDWSVATARAATDGVVIVLPAGDPDEPGSVHGGPTRSASVRAGLSAVPIGAAIVCVHDAARPFASPDLYAAVVAAVRAGADGAIPGLPVTDTIKTIDRQGNVTGTPDRATLVAVQTPQAFDAAILRRAHEAGGEGTDDATLVERVGGRVVVVGGELENRKITLPDDLDWARMRVGGA